MYILLRGNVIIEIILHILNFIKYALKTKRQQVKCYIMYKWFSN